MPMNSPEVSVLLCRHTPDNVGAIVNALPNLQDPTYYTGIELAYDDNDPLNDARRNVAEIQAEAQRYMCGKQTGLYRLRRDAFYGAFVTAAVQAGRGDLKILLVDAGRTTNGQENLERVTKGFSDWSIISAWEDSKGDVESYILRRAEDIVDSLTFRENLVADQVESILDTNGREPMSVIVGANHYGLLPRLRERDIEAAAIVVDRPSNTAEMAVANMLRTGREFEPRILVAMGLAEWIAPKYLSSGEMFNKLRYKSEGDLRRAASSFYDNPDMFYKNMPILYQPNDPALA